MKKDTFSKLEDDKKIGYSILVVYIVFFLCMSLFINCTPNENKKEIKPPDNFRNRIEDKSSFDDIIYVKTINHVKKTNKNISICFAVLKNHSAYGFNVLNMTTVSCEQVKDLISEEIKTEY